MGKTTSDVGNNTEVRFSEATASGIVQGPESPERFLSRDGKAICVSKLPLADFCQQYEINETIQGILEREGFETAGAVLEISEASLKAKLKIGQIGELRRALREFISKELLDSDVSVEAAL
ncbi:hypothetical protein DFH09DRAFT_1287964 [Mycena vulgaris]|nr:hypothetical protein DFH09DRAFT_1287964 [Mycena vulgaris]